MAIAAEIAMLAASFFIIVLAILAIPILIDLRKIVKDWKNISDLLRVGIAPITWSASLISGIFQRLVEKGEEAIARNDDSDKK